MIDLNSLKSAFSNISKIGRGEKTFTVVNTPIVMRALLPLEEVDVQNQANQEHDYYKEEHGADETVATRVYLETFRFVLLSHAIVQVGSLDLRNVETIETGETLSSGVTVKVSKIKAVRSVLESLSGEVVLTIYQYYSDMILEVDIESYNSLNYEPLDISEEIENLEKRVEYLKDKQTKSEAFANRDTEDLLIDQEPQVETPQQEEPVQQDPPPHEDEKVVQPRKQVFPSSHAPPPVKKETPPPRQAQPQAQNSFMEKNEDGFPPSALRTEHERISRMRRDRQNPPQHRRPPHSQAKETNLDTLAKNTSAEQVGSRDGVPVFSLNSPEDIGDVREAPTSVPIDPQPQSSKNPRFKSS